MLAIEAVVFSVSAGFAVVIVGTALVIVGIRHEERCGTLTRQHPPTLLAILARRVLGTYIRRPSKGHAERGEPTETPQEANVPGQPAEVGLDAETGHLQPSSLTAAGGQAAEGCRSAGL
jgi:hypothetical protein